MHRGGGGSRKKRQKGDKVKPPYLLWRGRDKLVKAKRKNGVHGEEPSSSFPSIKPTTEKGLLNKRGIRNKQGLD